MKIPSEHYVTGDPTFAVNRQGLVVFWNDAAEEVFGYSDSDALGKQCWELLCGHDVNGNRYCFKRCPLIEMAFLHEPVHTFHSSFETATHQQKDFSVSCLAVYDEPGNEMLLHICHPEQEIFDHKDQPDHVEIQPEELSKRETEILALLAANVKTSEIASRLEISIRTVRTHIQHILLKLQVHKRRDAVSMGKRLGLI